MHIRKAGPGGGDKGNGVNAERGRQVGKKETYNEEQKTQIQIKELGTRLKSIKGSPGAMADVSDVTLKYRTTLLR